MNRYALSNIVKKFNRIRKPECYIKTIKNNYDFLKIKFSGTTAFYSCCFDEYFNDLLFLIEDELNLKLKIDRIKRRNLDEFLVTYKILKKSKKGGLKWHQKI